MVCNQVVKVVFSPNGTTKSVVDCIAQGFAAQQQELDLLRQPVAEETSFRKDTLVIIGMPVYAGRIPPLCREMLLKLRGGGAPAIVAAVYGNRDYDDALLELKDLAEANGFCVVGAGAFIAQHSIFPKVGEGRPDERDRAAIAEFASRCSALLVAAAPGALGSIKVRGNPAYRPCHPVPLKPAGDKRCSECGACVRICPTQSIPADNPRHTLRESCISCGACIHVCPTGARGFRGVAYRIAEKEFCRKNAAYKTPEVFYAT